MKKIFVVISLLLIIGGSNVGLEKTELVEYNNTPVNKVENVLIASEKENKSDELINLKEEDSLVVVDNTQVDGYTNSLDTITIVPGIGEATFGVSQESINKLNNELNKLPSKIIDKFVNKGWHIYVTNDNLNQKFYNGKYSFVEGVTDYNNKTIYIANTDTAIRESTIHEMGHFIDYCTGFNTLNNEFNNIYNEEVNIFKSNITNSSCVRDKMEFFAESFYYYYIDSSKVTPKMNEYIKNIIYNML